MKARISFDVDLSAFPALIDKATIRALVSEKILTPARLAAIARLHTVRKNDETDMDVKTIQIAEHMMEVNLLLKMDRDMVVKVTEIA